MPAPNEGMRREEQHTAKFFRDVYKLTPEQEKNALASLTNDPASQAEEAHRHMSEAAEEDMLFGRCPFCNTQVSATVFRMIEGLFQFECFGCGARGPKAITAELALKKWNERIYTGT